nr:(Fe-S)-binding protein [uncultured Methanospirillum sp.]
MAQYAQTVAHQCNECGKCSDECDFLIAYAKTPRELAEEVLQAQFSNDPTLPYSCNICGYCKEICPVDLDIGQMITEIREQMVSEKTGPLPGHKPAVDGQEFYLSDNFRIVSAGKNASHCEKVFFPGCALCAYSPDLVTATYEYLVKQFGTIGIALGCCGGPSQLIGRSEYARQIANQLEQEVKKTGATELIVSCPYCYKLLSERLTDIKPVSLFPLLQEAEDRILEKGTGTYSIHDPCSARNEPAIQNAARNLAEIAGYTIEEHTHTRDNTHCCGMGGMVFLANATVASAKACRTIRESSHDLVTYCATCRDIFAGQGKHAIHLLDLLFTPDPAAQAQKIPNSPEVATNNLKTLNQWVRSF